MYNLNISYKILYKTIIYKYLILANYLILFAKFINNSKIRNITFIKFKIK